MTVKTDLTTYTHCLRICIVPGHFEDERIRNVLDFCLKYGFKNVMLFINAEEYNVGHMTIEEAKPWVATIRKAKKIFNDAGISVSLNPWIMIGHLDRGRTLKPGQDFVTMEDMEGTSLHMVACMLDENWKRYYLEFAEYLIRETEPDTYWIEDDFRLHNHGELVFGGCFCEHHMREYNRRLGTNLSREEFVRRVFRKGKATPERKVWLDTSREVMRGLAEEVGKRIASLGLGTKVALMSSKPESHCMEARDWRGVLEGFAQGGTLINRIHLPCYGEMTGKRYIYGFNAISMFVRALSPAETVIYPELENAYFNTYSKDSRFLQFQVEASMPLLASGMTYDIFDFVGNGAVEALGYGPVLAELTPELQAVMDQKIPFSGARGIAVPVSERACYSIEIGEGGWQDLYNKEGYFAAFLSAHGINFRYAKDPVPAGEAVGLCASNLSYFSDEELEKLFREHFVFLEGGAVLGLAERGLGRLIGAKSAERIPADTNVQSYEEAAPDLIVEGIRGCRATAQIPAGDYVRVAYEEEVHAYTRLFDCRQRYVGPGIAGGKNFTVFPFVVGSDILPEQFHELRRQAV